MSASGSSSSELDLIRLWSASPRKKRFEAHELYGGADAVAGADVRAYAASLQQRSDQWLNLRNAFVTASMAATYCGRGYGGVPEMMRQARADRRGDAAAVVVTPAMRYGIEREAQFVSAYERLVWTGEEPVERAGLVICPDPGRGYFAASPDGLVGDSGALEIKVTASQRRLMRQPADQWLVQVQLVMACAKRRWCDLASCYRPVDNIDGRDLDSDRSEMLVRRVHYAPKLVEKIMRCATAYVRAVREGVDNVYELKSLREDDMIIDNVRYVAKPLFKSLSRSTS